MQAKPKDPDDTSPDAEPIAPTTEAPETEHIEEEGEPLGANFA